MKGQQEPVVPGAPVASAIGPGNKVTSLYGLAEQEGSDAKADNQAICRGW
ncbi:hypothetical protein GCM10028812_53550 [Ancylobacter sonchi]